MIQHKRNLNCSYFAKYLEKLSIFTDSDIKISWQEKELLDDFFRSELHILSEESIDYYSAEVKLLTVFLRFNKQSFCRTAFAKGLADENESTCTDCKKIREFE